MEGEAYALQGRGLEALPMGSPVFRMEWGETLPGRLTPLPIRGRGKLVAIAAVARRFLCRLCALSTAKGNLNTQKKVFCAEEDAG